MAFTDSAKFVGGSSQYLSAADSTSLSITCDLCIETWIKFTSLPGTNNLVNLFGKWVGAGNNMAYLFQFQDVSGTKSVRMINSSTGANVGLASVNWTPSTGTWYQMGCNFTASTHTFELFVNAASQGTATGSLLTSMADTTAIFTLGIDGDLTAGQYFDGQFFLTRVWSTTRTSGQLSANQCVLLGSTTNLKAEWSLDNVLTDNSGNSNTFTNHSSTFTADFPSTCAAVAVNSNFLAFM